MASERGIVEPCGQERHDMIGHLFANTASGKLQHFDRRLLEEARQRPGRGQNERALAPRPRSRKLLPSVRGAGGRSTSRELRSRHGWASLSPIPSADRGCQRPAADPWRVGGSVRAMPCAHEGRVALITRTLSVPPLCSAPPERHMLSRHVDQHRTIHGEGSHSLVIVPLIMGGGRQPYLPCAAAQTRVPTRGNGLP